MEEKTIEGKKDIWEELIKSWPSPIISRQQVWDWSGRILNPRTLRNQDSLGLGPKNRLKIGRRTAYIVRDLVAWMKSRHKD